MYTLLCREGTATGDVVTLRTQATVSQAAISDDKGFLDEKETISQDGEFLEGASTILTMAPSKKNPSR